MLLHESSLRAIQRYCTHNSALLKKSTEAGCLCCGATFAPSDVMEWTHEEDPAKSDHLEPSALCPRCRRQAVLPSAAPIALSPELLIAVRQYWFGHVS